MGAIYGGLQGATGYYARVLFFEKGESGEHLEFRSGSEKEQGSQTKRKQIQPLK